MLRFFDYLVHHKQRFKSIRVTFPECGHSYMECDWDMGLVNTKAGVCIPSDWIEQFKAARSQHAPYNIIEVQQDIVIVTFLSPSTRKAAPSLLAP
ncbi:hypothetical protein PoB_002974900 [Plakobranchus ocellatus]|uniref:Uncharacterized protein n=1 Tax=Plakobranchus ocellatus TaxID=259542 RepID=A0AAV4A6B2_9GAST|nr:hypothetical protein PoB_002974900 [Plakobranchus ocellatus]